MILFVYISAIYNSFCCLFIITMLTVSLLQCLLSSIQLSVAGRDRHPVRGGGTWLGVSTTGRIATLTNVRVCNSDIIPNAPSRGIVSQVTKTVNWKLSNIIFEAIKCSNGLYCF